MDKLGTEKRLKVWIPLLEKPNRDYVMTDKGDKNITTINLKCLYHQTKVWWVECCNN